MSASGTAVPPPTTVLQAGQVDRGAGRRPLSDDSQQVHPQRGNATRPGHAVLGDQLGHRLGGEVRTGQDHVGAGQAADEGQPPPQGVKERNQPEDDVLLTDPEHVTTGHRQRMQHDRPMGVQDPLRVSRRAGGVAERRGGPLVDVDRRHWLVHLRDQVLETDLAGGEIIVGRPDHHHVAKVWQSMPQTGDLRSETRTRRSARCRARG